MCEECLKSEISLNRLHQMIAGCTWQITMFYWGDNLFDQKQSDFIGLSVGYGFHSLPLLTLVLDMFLHSVENPLGLKST